MGFPLPAVLTTMCFWALWEPPSTGGSLWAPPPLNGGSLPEVGGEQKQVMPCLGLWGFYCVLLVPVPNGCLNECCWGLQS